MDRFDLEEKLTEYSAACEEMTDTLIYMIGDSEERPTEDEAAPEGFAAALGRGCHPAVYATAQQRPDPRCRRCAPV